MFTKHSQSGLEQSAKRANGRPCPSRLILTAVAALAVAGFLLNGCSMKEEIRRIEEVKKARATQQSWRTTNLTGEQIYLRTCNECHPKGLHSPLGPSLINTDKDYPDDEKLKLLIRQGKGVMPACSQSCLNDIEMNNLIAYVRQLNRDLREKEQK